MKTHSSQSGFAHVLVVVLAVLVLGVAGFAGWRVYDANKTSDVAKKPSSSSTVPAQTVEQTVQEAEQELSSVSLDQELDTSGIDADLSDL